MPMKAGTINATTYTLKQGTAVAGTVSTAEQQLCLLLHYHWLQIQSIQQLFQQL
jgi:hypothetical protein